MHHLAALDEAHFFLTENEKNCLFCPYRSLCGRGVSAGDLGEFEFADAETLADFEIELEQIGEIAF